MSKITFRADDDLIAQLDEFDASKSEVMREALREYLGGADGSSPVTRESAEGSGSIDEMLVERVDAIIEERLDERLGGPQDVNVNITLDGERAESGAPSNASRESRRDGHPEPSHTAEERKTDAPRRETGDAEGSTTCGQCGENVGSDHVYCPNCGEKASRRVFCECGDELRSDWGFCPSCGRRTPAADVLDNP